MVAAYAPQQKLTTLPRINPTIDDVTAMETASGKVATRKITTAALAILPRAANDPVGDLSTHSTILPEAAPQRAVPAGWHIQLGATPSLEAANRLLAKARAKNQRLLVAMLNHTEPCRKTTTLCIVPVLQALKANLLPVRPVPS